MRLSLVPEPVAAALGKDKMYLNAEQQAERVRHYTPGFFDPGVKRLVGALQRLIRARTMKEHQEALSQVFAKDLVWDAPPALLGGRDNVRTALYTIPKTLFDMDFEPELVEVKRLPVLGLQAQLVEVTGTIVLQPHRTLLVPPTLLLPKKLERKATFKLGVNCDGKIEVVHARLHNVPELPMPLRALTGYVVGTMTHLTEPIWSPILGYLRPDAQPSRQQRDRPSQQQPAQQNRTPEETASLAAGKRGGDAAREGREEFAPSGAAVIDEEGHPGGGYDAPDDLGIASGDYKGSDPDRSNLGSVFSPGAAIEHIGGAGRGWDSL